MSTTYLEQVKQRYLSGELTRDTVGAEIERAQRLDSVKADYLAGKIDRTQAAALIEGPQGPAPGSEEAFQQWYGGHAAALGLNPNPDDPLHKYDYRAAYRAGAGPGPDGHWPSEFKAPDHPNRYVDGIDTITGLKVAPAKPGFTQAGYEPATGGEAILEPERKFLGGVVNMGKGIYDLAIKLPALLASEKAAEAAPTTDATKAVQSALGYVPPEMAAGTEPPDPEALAAAELYRRAVDAGSAKLGEVQKVVQGPTREVVLPGKTVKEKVAQIPEAVMNDPAGALEFMAQQTLVNAPQVIASSAAAARGMAGKAAALEGLTGKELVRAKAKLAAQGMVQGAVPAFPMEYSSAYEEMERITGKPQPLAALSYATISSLIEQGVEVPIIARQIVRGVAPAAAKPVTSAAREFAKNFLTSTVGEPTEEMLQQASQNYLTHLADPKKYPLTTENMLRGVPESGVGAIGPGAAFGVATGISGASQVEKPAAGAPVEPGEAAPAQQPAPLGTKKGKTVVGGPPGQDEKPSLRGRYTLRQELADAAARGEMSPTVRAALEDAGVMPRESEQKPAPGAPEAAPAEERRPPGPPPAPVAERLPEPQGGLEDAVAVAARREVRARELGIDTENMTGDQVQAAIDAADNAPPAGKTSPQPALRQVEVARDTLGRPKPGTTDVVPPRADIVGRQQLINRARNLGIENPTTLDNRRLHQAVKEAERQVQPANIEQPAPGPTPEVPPSDQGAPAQPPAQPQVFTGKMDNGEYGASYRDDSGNRWQLMVNKDGSTYWGDYKLASARDQGRVIEGADKDGTPFTSPSAKAAREAADSLQARLAAARSSVPRYDDGRPVPENQLGRPFVQPPVAPAAPAAEAGPTAATGSEGAAAAAPPAATLQLRATPGRQIRVRGADPSRQYDMQLEAVELEDLQASHTPEGDRNPNYPAGLQPRGRDRAASAMQTRQMAATLNPDNVQRIPEKLGRGMPHIDEQGNVEGGNGRVIAFQIAAKDHPEVWAKYRERLIERAAEFGLDPEKLRGMKNPVVVARRLTQADPTEIARESNVTGTMAMSTGETANVDARRLPDTFLAQLQVGPDQTVDDALTAAGNRDFIRAFVQSVPEGERAGLMDRYGNLSRSGAARIKAGLFAKVFRGESGRRLGEGMLESMDPGTRNLENALFASLPQLAQVEGAIAKQSVRPEYSIADDLAAAADKYVALRQAGRPVKEALEDSVLFPDEQLTPFQQQLLRFMADNPRSAKALREALRGYAALVRAQPAPGQGDFFGATPSTREQLWQDAVSGKAPEEQGDLLAGEPRSLYRAGSTENGAFGGGMLLSPNTIPGEGPWRITYFSSHPQRRGEPSYHTAFASYEDAKAQLMSYAAGGPVIEVTADSVASPGGKKYTRATAGALQGDLFGNGNLRGYAPQNIIPPVTEIVHDGGISFKMRGQTVKGPEDVAYIFRHCINRDREAVRLLKLHRNGSYSVETVHVGALAEAMVHPREMFAYTDDVVEMWWTHNHPSGQVQPSAADMQLDARLAKAAKTLGITLHQGIITDGDSFYDMATGQETLFDYQQTSPTEREVGHLRAWEDRRLQYAPVETTKIRSPLDAVRFVLARAGRESATIMVLGMDQRGQVVSATSWQPGDAGIGGNLARELVRRRATGAVVVSGGPTDEAVSQAIGALPSVVEALDAFRMDLLDHVVLTANPDGTTHYRSTRGGEGTATARDQVREPGVLIGERPYSGPSEGDIGWRTTGTAELRGRFDWSVTDTRTPEHIYGELRARLEPEVHTFLAAVNNAARVGGSRFYLAKKAHKFAIKGPGRAVQNLARKGYLSDPLRTTINYKGEAPTPREIQGIINAMERQGYYLALDKNGQPDVDNLFDDAVRATKDSKEYRHVALKFTKGDGISREVLLIGENMFAAKEKEGHILYEISRTLKDIIGTGGFGEMILDELAPWMKKRAEVLQDAVYKHAYSADSLTSSNMPMSANAAISSGLNPGLPAALRVFSASANDFLSRLRHPKSASLISSRWAASSVLKDLVASLERFVDMTLTSFPGDSLAVVPYKGNRYPEATSGAMMAAESRSEYAEGLYGPEVLPPEARARLEQWAAGTQVVGPDGRPQVVYHFTTKTTKRGRPFDTFNTGMSEMGSHFGSADQAMSMKPDSMASPESFKPGPGKVSVPMDWWEGPADQKGGQLYPVYLRVTNPIRLTDRGRFSFGEVGKQLLELGIVQEEELDAIVGKALALGAPGNFRQLLDDVSRNEPEWAPVGTMMGDYEPKAQQLLQNNLRSKGYDGIVYLNRREGLDYDNITHTPDEAAALSDQEFQDEYGTEDSWVVFRPNQVKSAAPDTGVAPGQRYDSARTSIAAEPRRRYNPSLYPPGAQADLDRLAGPLEEPLLKTQAAVPTGKVEPKRPQAPVDFGLFDKQKPDEQLALFPGTQEERAYYDSLPEPEKVGDTWKVPTRDVKEFRSWAGFSLTPTVNTDPVVMYRSVSPQEFNAILESGRITGGGNVFNGFDPRKEVLFGDELNELLMWQGEDFARTSAYLAYQKVKDSGAEIDNQRKQLKTQILELLGTFNQQQLPGKPKASFSGWGEPRMLLGTTTIWRKSQLPRNVMGYNELEEALRLTQAYHKLTLAAEKLGERFRRETDRVNKVRARRRSKLPDEVPTSYVLETAPIVGGRKYAAGESGLQDMAEYGFDPGQVTTQMIARVHEVRDQEVINAGPLEEYAGKQVRVFEPQAPYGEQVQEPAAPYSVEAGDKTKLSSQQHYGAEGPTTRTEYVQLQAHEAFRKNLNLIPEADRQWFVDFWNEADPTAARSASRKWTEAEQMKLGEELVSTQRGARRISGYRPGAPAPAALTRVVGALTMQTWEAVRLAQEKVRQDPGDPNAVAALNEAMARMYALEMQLAGRLADSARGLQAGKAVRRARLSADPQARVMAALAGRGMNLTAAELQQFGQLDPNDVLAQVRFMQEVMRRRQQFTWKDWLDSYRYFNMLSGGNTHIYNLLSNTLWMSDVLLKQPLEILIDLPKAAITGKRTYYVQDYLAGIKGSLAGAPTALRAAIDIIRYGVSRQQASQMLESDKYGPAREAPGGGANPLNWTMRALSAADALFSTARTLGALEQLATRRALQEGNATEKRIAELKQDEQVMADAVEEGKRSTFTNDAVSQKVLSYLRRKHPAAGRTLSVLFPFVRVTENITRFGLGMTPGIGALPVGGRWKGEGQGQRVIAEQALGFGLAMLGYALAKAGDAEGPAPPEEKEREKFFDQGKQPYSVRLGGQWYRWSRIGPLAFPFAVGVALRQMEEKGMEPNSETAAAVLGELGKMFTNMTLVQSLGQMVEAVSRPAEAGARLGSNLLTQLVPAAAQMRQWEAAFADNIKDPQGVLQRLAAGLPGLDRYAPDKVSQFGKPVARPNRGAAAFWPSIPDRPTQDPVLRELIDLGVDYPGVPSKTVTRKGEKYKLTPEQHREMKRETGGDIYRALERRMNMADWAGLNPAARKRILGKIIERTKERERNDWRGLYIKGQKGELAAVAK